MRDDVGLYYPKQIELRDYQRSLLSQAIQAAATYDRICMYGPTGSGKTEVGMKLVDILRKHDKRVTWCVNRIDLIEQTSQRFIKHGLDHGIIQAKHANTDYTQPIQIASIQTINRRKFLPGLDVIIIDEAHGATSPTYRKFLDAHPVKVFGLTATPFSRGLGQVFQTLIHTTTIADLTQEGWLVPANYYAPDRPDLRNVRIVAGDYHEGELGLAVDQPRLVGNIVDEWKKRAEGLQTVVFATNIEHSKHIVEQFRFRGVKAEHLDAYTPADERKAIINRLRSGETTVVSNVSVLAEGFDCPAMECMILARPTRSIIRYLQMVGRVLRPAPGKESALVLDHSCSVETLGFADDPRPLVLDDGTKKERKVPVEPQTHTCPKCKRVSSRKVWPCIACGYKPEKAQIITEVAEGTLKELRRKHLNKDERQVVYSALVGYAQEKGYKPGYVEHAFNDILKTYPRGLKWEPGPMIPVVRNYIVSKRIRAAHRRAA